MSKALAADSQAAVDEDRLLTSRAYTAPRFVGPVTVANIPGGCDNAYSTIFC